jgi:hypothetical protein
MQKAAMATFIEVARAGTGSLANVEFITLVLYNAAANSVN